MANTPRPLLKVSDLAQRYGKSESSIYRLRCYHPEQLPPAVKIGNTVRWRPEDVEKWEAAQTDKVVAA
ncbi:helix-turn-helix transcriptional regulator [Bifidobacterium scaligerum]|uniref:Helix-turn-helix domain-containing protein n=1 Tax=Bifidobacterium scaligerum TaxID=2052656 RepID=A0A2M9HQD2_9BIFI|nr:helix-turn-helix domain-containing protein [Bifidobacterium scaligerum]PJM79015.1 hypothetical protein CUU80_06660 [Bifidobacterium scaligerum]